jgi:ribosome recycling factor
MKDEALVEVEKRMKKVVEGIEGEFSSIRTGRASITLLDTIRVDAYGSQMPINQLANITVPEQRLLVIHPWDKSVISSIEKSILASDLGLTPSNDGNVIRIPIPKLTEERRKVLVKHLHKLAEGGRIAVRQVRRDVNSNIKDREKQGDLSEDMAHTLLDEVQELTDHYIKEIDERLKSKEEEVLEV